MLPKSLFIILFAALSFSASSQSCIDPNLIDPTAPCYLIYAPVCGCDGVTYGNDCEATNHGVTSFTNGPCQPNGSNGCSAYFVYGSIDSSGLLVEFFDIEMNNSVYQSVTWDFGDGNTLNALPNSTIQHQYSAKGLYQVCLTIASADSTCLDTYCQTMIVADTRECVDSSVIDLSRACPDIYEPVCGLCDGITYSNICDAFYYSGIVSFFEGECYSYPPCDAYFYYWEDGQDSSLFTVYFSTGVNVFPPSPSGSQSWLWDFGDGNTSTEQSPVHVYTDTSINVYRVCLTVSDTAEQCVETYCDSIYIGKNDSGCHPWFGYDINPDGTVVIYPDSATENAPDWNWIIGDGSVSNDPNLIFPVDSTMNDTICIYIMDCNQIYCVSGMEIYLAFLEMSSNKPVHQLLNFTIYPNPASEKTNIELSVASKTTASIILRDLPGNELISMTGLQLESGRNQFTLNTSNLSSGIYFIELITDEKRDYRKLLVAR